MARIKIVPLGSPNADGEWREIPVGIPAGMKWREMEAVVAPYVPAGYFIVSAQQDPRDRLNTAVPLRR